MSIVFILSIVVLFIITYFMLNSFSHKLLYKDDGNWFYYAVFKEKGLRSYKIFDGKLYFGAEGFYTFQNLCAFFYRLWGRNKLTFFNRMKIIAYALQSVALYVVIFMETDSIFYSMIMSLMFSLIYFIPSRNYYLTYAENFQMTPVLIAYIIFKLALLFQCPLLLIICGCIISFVMHWKITGVVFVVLFPLLFISGNFFLFSCYYIAGLILANVVIPLCVYDRKRFSTYFFFFVRNILYYFMLTGGSFFTSRGYDKMIISKGNKFVGRINGIDPEIEQKICETIDGKRHKVQGYEKGYIANRQKTKGKRKKVIEIVLKYIREFQLIIPIAASQIIYGIYTKNYTTAVIIIFFICAILVWFMQGGLTNEHKNIVTPPLFILYAIGLYQLKSINGFGTVIIAVLIITYLCRFVPAMYKEFKSNSVDLPCYGVNYNAYFKEALNIGEYIKQNSTIDDRIYVWGNMPIVYLYAERMCVRHDYLFTYPTGIGKIHSDIYRILYELSDRPPKFFVLFQYIDIVDEWNMDKIQNEINVPYKLDKIFEIKAGKLQFTSIPVYKRDDKLFIELLIEKYRIANNVKYLKQALAIEPQNQEVKFWLRRDKDNLDYEQSLQMLNDFKIDGITKKLVVIDLMKKYDKTDEIESVVVKFEINSQNWRIFLELGEYYFNKGEMKTALNMYNESAKLNSLSAELLNNFGVLSFQLQDSLKSIQFLEKALDILPEYEDAKENLKEIMAINKSKG